MKHHVVKQNKTKVKKLNKLEPLIQCPNKPLTSGAEATVLQTSTLHEQVALGVLTVSTLEAVV